MSRLAILAGIVLVVVVALSRRRRPVRFVRSVPEVTVGFTTPAGSYTLVGYLEGEDGLPVDPYLAGLLL